MNVNFKNRNTKSGVSLIVVMLFMLVATIAATATYKWITSQGRASSSRMLEREAYQSSLAGIENARAWIAWHANDAGALIKQYLDGDKKPVRMDRQLRSLQREGQSYSVWLTGVNTENSTYRLKILSKGESRNGAASHSEVAILNVDGLYQVRVPAEKKASKVDFDYAYFGGSTSYSGEHKATSMLINGNWSGNPQGIEKNFVVTGNVTLSGSKIEVGGTTCIGGNLSTQNGFIGKDLYVGGDVSSFNGKITGNAYLDGNFDVGSACGDKNFAIFGNVTLNGTLKPGDCSGKRIEGNLCVGETGKLYAETGNNPFSVKGNIWIPGNDQISAGQDDNHNNYAKLVLGDDPSSLVYIAFSHPYSDYKNMRETKKFKESASYNKRCGGYGYCEKWSGDNYQPYVPVEGQNDMYYLYNYSGEDVTFTQYYNNFWHQQMGAYFVGGKLFYDTYMRWNLLNFNTKAESSPYCKKGSNPYRPECHVSPWFKSNGTVSRNLPSQVPFECAEQVKTDCDAIWEKKSGCDGSNYKVDDMLVTAYSKFEPYANKVGCASRIVNLDHNAKLNFNMAALNDCYKEAVESDQNSEDKKLYNGYLVLKFSNVSIFNNPSGELDGKYIFIFDQKIGNAKFPSTKNSSKIFVYLADGSGLIQLQNGSSGQSNYFIYTKGDVSEIHGYQKLAGSIYATAENCAKLNNINNNTELEYNKSLLEDLAENGVVCNNDGSPCGGSGGSSTGGSSGSINYGGLDPHYISMAPQLGVSLESQYESREATPKNADEKKIDSAYIVLPRIIYLPANPKGSLRDYYNVLALNGSKLKKENVSVSSCASSDASLSVSGSLYSGTALQKGVYECKTSASGYDENVPFWVVVGSEETKVPAVYFEKESQGINATGSAEINLIVEASEEITVEFSKSSKPDGWELKPAPGVSCNDNVCEIKVSGTSGTAIPLYTITTTGATSGTFSVQLREGKGYRLGSPWLSDVHISSNVRVKREEIENENFTKYCDEHPGICPDSKNDWPKGDCESSEWVTIASGIACATVQKNDEWNCVAGGTGEGKLVESGSIKSGCVAIIPPESFDLSTQAANTTVSLRASVFAKKQKMVVGFTGDVGAGNNPKIDIFVERSTGTVLSTCDYGSETDENKRCAIDVFQGDQVTLKLDTSSNDHKNFNYWKCENAAGNCPSGSDVLANTVYPAFTIQGSAEYSLTAHFGEADRHCFFDEFNRSQVVCDGSFDEKEYCIDNCQSGSDGVCAGVSNGPTYTKAKWNLVSGAQGNIRYENGSVSVERSSKKNNVEQSAIKVMSTVHAGLYGTMKALLQVPKATSSNDRSSARIQNSGLILRSNGNVSEYMMLNVYANASGNLEVQLCNENGKNCKSSVLTDNGSSASVSANAMVMVAATLKSSDAGGDMLVVEASKDNYYGSPKAYSCQFSLNEADYAKYLNRSYEYVGFGIADANFKIYGIGWKSEDYGSECHDTYPTVKCSFRAVAENGIVPTGKDVKPWIGHSAWFNSKSCTESYYYVNGRDACGGYETCADGYRFDPSGSGLHGYKNENGEDVKTAYASLNCSVSDDAQNAWVPTGENERAHCGKFWTGEFTECSEHKVLKDAATDYGAGEGVKCEMFDASVNLRAAKLVVELETVSGTGEYPDLEVFLLSKDKALDNDLDNDHELESDVVKISRFGTSSFDVVDEMTANADGFDPEKVSGICFNNNGSTVRVKSVLSNCANAVSLSGCRAKYAGGSQWNIEADVSNPDKIQSFTVTRTVDGNTNPGTISCSASDSKCLFDGTTAKLSFADNRNPYKEDQGKSYAFKVSLTGNGNATAEKECSVDPSTIGKITATCKIDGNSTVEQGKGLPKFSGNFTGCPEGGCAWKITTDNGKISKTGFKNFALSFSENMESPWNVGTYRYRVEPANADYPFDGCSSEFKIVAAKSSSSSEAELSSSSAAVGESSSSGEGITAICSIKDAFAGTYATFDVNSIVASGNFNAILTGNGISQNIDCSASNCWNNSFQVPSIAGLYTYVLSTQRGSRICSAKVLVKDALSCSVDKTEIGLGESFTFTSSKVAPNCWNCSFYDGENTENNFNFGSVIRTPATLGVKELKLNCTCENVAASCSQTVAVSEIAPTVECPDKLTKSVGSEVSATPKSLTGCPNGCNWTLKDVNSQVKSDTIKNGEGFSFNGESSEGTKHYTFEVSNTKGSAECSFDVEYVENANVVVTDKDPHTYKSGTCIDIENLNYGYSTELYFSCSAQEGKRKILYNGTFKESSDQYNRISLKIGLTSGSNFSASNICVENDKGNDLTCSVQNYE